MLSTTVLLDDGTYGVAIVTENQKEINMLRAVARLNVSIPDALSRAAGDNWNGNYSFERRDVIDLLNNMINHLAKQDAEATIATKRLRGTK